jgi:O-antigen/teichoic acid export membrane protein
MNYLRFVLEKIIGKSAAYIARGGMWLGIDQAAGFLSSIILTVAFANLLPADTYGIYRYILSIFGMLTIATLPNMNVAVLTATAKGMEGSLGRAARTRVKWGFLGSCVSLAIGGFYFLFQENEIYAAAFVVMAAFLPFMDSPTIYGAFLKGRLLFREYALYGLINRFSSAVILIGVLFLTDDVLAILFAFFVPYVIVRWIIFRRVIRRFSPNELQDPETISYGKHLSVIQFLNVAINYIDSILIFHLLGPVSLATYSIAQAPIAKIQQSFSIISELVLPKFSAASRETARKLIMLRLLWLCLITLAGIALYLLVIPVLFNVFLPQYRGAIIFSQILALGLIGLPFSFIYTFFQSHALKKEIYQYNITIRVAQIILVPIFVSLYGILGAAIARVIFQVISVGALLLLFKRSG